MKASVLEALMRTQPWAIDPTALERMRAYVASIGAGDFDPLAVAGEGPQPTVGGIAVLPLHGVISQRSTFFSMFFGGTSTERFSEMLRGAVADPAVSRIVIDVDSPGGTVSGVPELGAEIFAARAKKHITAIANTQAASAAYWLASQATEFVVSPSAEIGSIGVFVLHADFSRALDAEGITTTFIRAGKFKAEGNPYEPLSDEAQAAIQERVDDYYGMFVKAVARGRGKSVDDVRSSFGQGRVVGADDAVKRGMADRVQSFADAVGRSSRRGGALNAAAIASTDTDRRERRLRLLRLT